MPRIRRLGIAAVMAAVMLVGGVPAFATDPLAPSSYVTDSDSFLSDKQRANIETRAESLNSKYHVPVYTVRTTTRYSSTSLPTRTVRTFTALARRWLSGSATIQLADRT